MKKMRYVLVLITVATTVLLLHGCSKSNTLEVTATAYTSSVGETDSTPTLAAWGDTLTPGMKAIAVSRDLIKKGLTHGTEVTIEGFEGKYKVLDKMNKRWTKKIDIYMGLDRKKAIGWGKQQVIIHWVNEPS